MACGVKMIIKVLLKWPRMPATANAMPAKYVNVSPTNTCDGYLLASLRRLRE